MSRRTATGLAAAALACAALAAPGAAGAAPAWLPAVGLTAATSTATAPQVAVGPQGDATAIWYRYAATTSVVESAERPAGAPAWHAPTTVSVGPLQAVAPQVAVDAQGTATAVWWDSNGASPATTAVRAATRPVGGAWTASVPLSTGGAVEDPHVAVDARGDAVAVWRGYDQSYVITAAFRPAGGAWQAPVVLSTDAASSYAATPKVAIDAAGDAVAVWYRSTGGSHLVIQAAKRPAGGAWQPPVDLSSASLDAGLPGIAVAPSGDAVAVWEAEESGVYVVQAASMPALSGVWQVPVNLSATGAESAGVQVAVDAAGRAHAIWTWNDGVGTAVQTASRPAGGAWSAPTNLSDPGRYAMDPAVAVDPTGDVAASWADYDGTHYIDQGAAQPAGGGWSAPADLSASGADAAHSQVAIDAQGDAVALWVRAETSGAAPVQAAAYDAAGPALNGLAIPATAVAGQPVAFAVSPLDAWSTLGATTWSFGDGGSAVGASTTHTFAAAGTYAVTLTGTDALGNATHATGTISVAPAAPAAPGPPSTPGPPTAIAPPTAAPLTLTHAAESHKTWRRTKSAKHKQQAVGTTFSFTLDHAATVSLAFTQRLAGRKAAKGKCVAQTARNRHAAACTRTVAKGTLTAKGKAGKNTIAFKGIVSRTKHLAAGSYTVTLTAIDPAHQRSKPVTLKFTIAR